MTPEDKQYLIELIHATFEHARSQGIQQPIDLAPFGKLLRILKPDFSHQTYGHEKLLYLLREFHELLCIRKDAEVMPPRYYVSIRSNLSPTRSQTRLDGKSPLQFLDARFSDGSLADRYLGRLAESSALIHHRLDKFEQRFTEIHRELEQGRANEVTQKKKVQELQAELNGVVKNVKAMIDWKISGLKINPQPHEYITNKSKLITSAASLKISSIIDIKHNFYIFDVLEWLIPVGSEFRKGQVIAVAVLSSGSKTGHNIHAPCNGLLKSIEFHSGKKLGGEVVIGHIET